jgi:hypothetical protein
MTPRSSLLLVLAAALLAAAGADAQTRRPSREDLLDALTRHIQICSEISDQQARLSCYDKLQTQVGDVQAPAPSPTPLATTQKPPLPPPPAALPPPPSSITGGPVGSTPLAAPPLMVPGGGAATLGNNPSGSMPGGSMPGGSMPGGSMSGGPTPLGPPQADPDRAFNPRDATTAYRPPEAPMARPQPPLRRTGPRPVPANSASLPVVSLQVTNLTYGDSRYWQVTVAVTSNVGRTIDAQVQCTFLNGGRSVGEAHLGPIQLAAGEQAATELIGPPTTAYVDSTNCRMLSP